MTTADELKGAVWAQHGSTWKLITRKRDGGRVLGEITGGRFVSSGYRWTAYTAAGLVSDHHISLRGARNALRRELRSEIAAREVQP